MSAAPYGALDFALLRDPARLAENQRRFAARVGFDAARLYQTRQVHGRTVLAAEGDAKAMTDREADALVAEAGSGAAVGMRVADCVPILLGDRVRGHVAAVHAGWRGVVANVLGASIEELAKLGTEPGDLAAAIGPCIGPCCFEVGADVGAQIAEATSPGVIARRDEPRGKAYVDLRLAVRTQLRALGIPNEMIEDVGGCTRDDAEAFYSYRRDGDASGRLLGVIAARDLQPRGT